MNPIFKKVIRFVAGLAIIFVGVFIMNGLIGMKEPPSVVLPENSPRPVKAMVVSNTTIQPRIPVEGKVEAWQRIDLIAEVNGLLSRGGKEFREGERFSKGEVILQLDDSEARASIKSARATFLQLVTGTLSTIKIDFPDRIDEWESFVKSIDINDSLPELPNPQSDRERFYIINRGIESSYHSIRSSEERLSKFTIRAPFNGFVSTAMVKPGSLVLGGAPLGVFVGTGEYEVRSSINSEFIQYVKIGDKVEFFSKGKVVAEGRLDRISSSVNPATQSATVYFKIRSKSRDFDLRDGMYLPGKLITGGIENCIQLEVGLINSNKVFTVVNGELTTSEVQVLFETYETALVSGLKNGEVVMTDQFSGAYAGMKVNPSTN